MKISDVLALIGAGLALATLMGWVGRRQAPRFLRGDVNGDGVVNMADVVALERIVTGLDPVNPRADVNGDGLINQLDIDEVQRIVLGLA